MIIRLAAIATIFFGLGVFLVSYRAYQLAPDSTELQFEMSRYAFWSALVTIVVAVATILRELVGALRRLNRVHQHG